MRAIILAAGLGRRMLPLTRTVPKGLLPIGDSTILGRIVDGLIDVGAAEIVVVTGHLAETVRGFLAERYPGVAFRYVHNARFEETNNIVSLAMALDALPDDDDVMVIESDVLFDPVLLRRLAARRQNCALVDRYRPGMDGTVVAVEGGVVTGVFPPHLQGEDFVYGDKYKTLNVYYFTGEFCRRAFRPLLSCYANLIDAHSYYELVLGMLVNMQRERIFAEVVDGESWSEVDDPNDFQVARFVFEPERRREILERTQGGHWNFSVLDFTFLRNMYFPTDAMLASMRQALPQLVRSYGSAQVVLDEKLAALLYTAPGRVRLLNGASQLFPLAAELFAAERPLYPAPTFGEYPRWLGAGATYPDTPGVDLDALEARAGAADLVVVVSPNNPTGTTLPTERLHALIARHPATRFLVDESFADFSDETPLLRRLEAAPLPNVVVLASLSKTLGVPGLRLGYVYTWDEALHAALGRRLPIWNANAQAEYFLELCLKFRGELAASFVQTARDRAAFAAQLAAQPFCRAVHASGGNFLLVELTGDDPARAARAAEELLRRHRIYVKDVSARLSPPRPRLRLGVRLPDENQRLIAALAEIKSP